MYETFFKNHPGFNGTYLELGAYDGSQESNSRFFDLCLGWKGLLIKRNPKKYQKTNNCKLPLCPQDEFGTLVFR